MFNLSHRARNMGITFAQAFYDRTRLTQQEQIDMACRCAKHEGVTAITSEFIERWCGGYSEGYTYYQNARRE